MNPSKLQTHEQTTYCHCWKSLSFSEFVKYQELTKTGILGYTHSKLKSLVITPMETYITFYS